MRTKLATRLFLCPAALTLCSIAAAQDAGPPAGWTATAPLADARHSSCAVRLADGRVLVSGGTGAAGDLASTELYLAEGTFLPGPKLNSARSQHTCTLLDDGRVLVAGGDTEGAGSGELYDPKANAWQPVAGTGQPRRGHTATPLPDGRVLLAGGTGDVPLDSLEIFDPQTNSLTRLDATLAEARDQHAAALLPDGRVLLMAGRGAQGPLASTEIFDPAGSAITAGPPLATARAGHSGTRLDDGRVLVAGGFDGAQEIDTAEMLDPDTLAWTPLAVKLNSARRDHVALLIPGNGGVLIAGGLLQGQALAATELFLPVENTFLALGSLTAPRTGLAAAAVDAGMILAAGGLNDNGPQTACGVLVAPAISFTKSLYHPQETALASGSFFPPSTTVSLSLELATGTVREANSRRLLTSSVTTTASRLNIPVGFAAVPILLTDATDAGKTARLTATAPGGITAVAAVPVKVPTTLTLTLPQPNFEGLNATITAQLVRPANAQPMTGSVTIAGGLPPPPSGFTDGTSNTITVGEGPTSTPVNTTGTSVFVQKGMTNLPAGLIPVTARYSGDAANEASTATGSFTVVSKTPLVQLSTDTPAPQVGTPFTISAVVKPAGSVAAPRTLNGTITVLQSGFLLGTPGAKFSPNTAPPQLGASLPFTPLTLNPISLSATYTGDTFFRNATSSTLTVNVQKATPVLTLTAPPTYQCAQPSTFTATLTFPPALGLSNRSVSVTALLADGSVQSVTPTGQGTLVPSATNLGTATATFSVTLPLDISAVVANFSGDSLLAPAASRGGSTPILQKSPVTVQFLNLPGTVTSPANLVARVTSSACGATPRGTVEFLDGAQSLAVVSIAPNATILLPPNQTPATADATLSISRPVGLHNLQVKYSGDAHYSPAAGAVVPVVFQ